MVRSVVYSGTDTGNGSEQTLEDDTTHEGEVWDGVIDLTNMDSKDTVVINLYVKALSGGTLDLLYSDTFTGVQSDPIVYVRAMTIMKEWKLTLTQTYTAGGSYKTFPWTIYH